MAYTLKGYSHFPYYLLKKLVSDLSANGVTTLKFALMKDTYTPSQDNDTVWDDIKAHDIDGDAVLDPNNDYPAGGLAVSLLAAGASVSVSGRVTKFDSDDPTADNVSIGGYKGVLYDASPALDTEKVLIAYSDFGGLKASNSGTYKIVVNAAGWFTLTVPA